ncbi:Ganglioside-induced differentiation-associated protein [Dirofilaria immitis]
MEFDPSCFMNLRTEKLFWLDVVWCFEIIVVLFTRCELPVWPDEKSKADLPEDGHYDRPKLGLAIVLSFQNDVKHRLSIVQDLIAHLNI